MKLNLKKQFSTLALVTSFAATASMSLAGECRVAEASMDKPGGFPDRALTMICLLYTSPSPRDKRQSRMPSSA